MPELPDMDGLYARLTTADEERDHDAEPLAQVAWDLYTLLGTVTADLKAFRAWSHHQAHQPAP